MTSPPTQRIFSAIPSPIPSAIPSAAKKRKRATYRLWATLFVLLVFFCNAVLTSPPSIVVDARFLPPSASHWLGTDHYGRDTLRMVLRGGFWSLSGALAAIALALLCALPLGVASARASPPLRNALLNGADLLFAFPAILTALLVATLYKPGWLAVLCAITLFNIPVFWRVACASARHLYLAPFVLAARALGASEQRIFYKHILPNTLAPLLFHAATQVSLAVLAEASFAYLGLGAPPPNASWGRIIREAQNFLAFSSLPLLATACLMVASVTIFSKLAQAYAQK